MTRTALPLIAAASLLFSISTEACAMPVDKETSGPVVLTDNQLDGLTAGQTGDLALPIDNAVEGPQIWGFGFAIAAILKFKAHHGNPTFPWLDTPFGR